MDEAKACQNMEKYQGADFISLAQRYVKEMGSDNKLYAGGVIVRKSNMSAFNENWWSCMADSIQDQISLPVSLHRCSIVPSRLPEAYLRIYMLCSGLATDQESIKRYRLWLLAKLKMT